MVGDFHRELEAKLNRLFPSEFTLFKVRVQVLICYGVQNTKGVAFSKELNDAYVHTYYKVIGELQDWT